MAAPATDLGQSDLHPLVIYPDPTGVHRLPTTAFIALPAHARRRCGIRTGDAVLMAADPADELLIIVLNFSSKVNASPLHEIATVWDEKPVHYPLWQLERATGHLARVTGEG